MSDNDFVTESANATVAALKETLGDDFDAMLIVYPSATYLETSNGDIPCGIASTATEEHTLEMVGAAIDGMGIVLVEDKPVIWTPDQQVTH